MVCLRVWFVYGCGLSWGVGCLWVWFVYGCGLSMGVVCLWQMKRSPRCWMGQAGRYSRSYPGETGFLLQNINTVKSLIHGTYTFTDAT